MTEKPLAELNAMLGAAQLAACRTQLVTLNCIIGHACNIVYLPQCENRWICQLCNNHSM